MPYDTERLRERLLDLERSRSREREQRRQAEALLAGLMPLSKAESTTDIFAALVNVLRELLVFEEAFLLVEVDGGLEVVTATDDRLLETEWELDGLFRRVLGGEPVSIFDIGHIPEWQRQPAEIRDRVCSALHIPLTGAQTRAILVCTHSQRGAFSSSHLQFAERVGPLAAQALRNIEQRQREIEQLARKREHETSFRLLIEHSPDAIWVSRDNRIVYANPAMVEMLGYRDASQLVGQSLDGMLHADDASFYGDQRAKLEEIGQSTSPYETRLQCTDGSTVLLEIVGLYLRFAERPAVMCVGRDITERKELTARIMQMDRMIAAGTLAAGVGHEINNPLSFVTANVDFARGALEQIRGMIDPSGARDEGGRAGKISDEFDEIEHALQAAEKGAARIAAIVKELRTFSQSHETQTRAVELGPLLDSTKQMAWNQIRHRARFVEDYEMVPPVLGTESHLAQLLMNLLNNAAQAIPMGEADENEICVRTYLDGDEVVIEVSDTGTGIAPEDRAHIFDPFFTTKPPDQGTGLGLAISQQIVTSFSGRIEFDTEVGHGTTFRVYLLPAHTMGEFSEPSEAGEESEAELVLPAGLRVLVIDDEAEVGQAVRRLLGKKTQVERVEEAGDALKLLGAGADFDCILCDLLMPQVSGMEFYRRLEQLRPEMVERVIFITAGAFMDSARDFLARVDNPCIYKPFSQRVLVRDLCATLN